VWGETGRKPKPWSERKSDLFVFKVPGDMADTMTELYNIARRDGVDVKDIMALAIKEYVDVHGPGNSQTLIPSFVPGGSKSNGQVEAEIIRELLNKGEVRYVDVVNRVRNSGLGNDRILPAVNHIVKALVDKEVAVWR